MLFKDRVFNKTAIMSDVGDVFVADIQYYDHYYESDMNKYHVEMEDSASASNCSLKKIVLALDLDFSWQG